MYAPLKCILRYIIGHRMRWNRLASSNKIITRLCCVGEVHGPQLFRPIVLVEEGWISRRAEGVNAVEFRATPSGVLRWILFYNFIGRDRVSAFWILHRAYVPRPLCSFHPRYILRASSRGISYLGIISSREKLFAYVRYPVREYAASRRLIANVAN